MEVITPLYSVTTCNLYSKTKKAKAYMEKRGFHSRFSEKIIKFALTAIKHIITMKKSICIMVVITEKQTNKWLANVPNSVIT